MSEEFRLAVARRKLKTYGCIKFIRRSLALEDRVNTVNYIWQSSADKLITSPACRKVAPCVMAKGYTSKFARMNFHRKNEKRKCEINATPETKGHFAILRAASFRVDISLGQPAVFTTARVRSNPESKQQRASMTKYVRNFETRNKRTCKGRRAQRCRENDLTVISNRTMGPSHPVVICCPCIPKKHAEKACGALTYSRRPPPSNT